MDSLKLAISRSVKRYDFHPIQRILYSQDLLKLPAFLRRFVKYPVCVVQPENDSEIISILKLSEKYSIPIVPRGAATSAYGGTTTLKECIVVDFTRMNKFEIRNGSVIAESGVVWLELEKELNKAGYALRIYPSSAPASTVGGWIAQGGYGIGSLKYGGIKDNLEWIEVADFEGIKKVSGDDLKYYIGAHGTTGLIIRVCLKLRKNSCLSNYAVRCDFKDALELIEGAYHALYMDKKLSNMLGCGRDDVLLLTFENDAELEFDRELGNVIWENRFNLLKAAARGNVIFTEAVLPYDTAPEFYKTSVSLKFATKAIFTSDVVVFLGILSAGYYSLLKAIKFVKLAEKFGGRVYSTGMVFPHKKVLDDSVRDYKKSIDPKSLLNPGKAVQSNLISRLIRVAEMIA